MNYIKLILLLKGFVDKYTAGVSPEKIAMLLVLGKYYKLKIIIIILMMLNFLMISLKDDEGHYLKDENW